MPDLFSAVTRHPWPTARRSFAGDLEAAMQDMFEQVADAATEHGLTEDEACDAIRDSLGEDVAAEWHAWAGKAGTP